MQGFQVPVDGVDEVPVEGRRDVFFGQAGFHGVLVMAHPGVEVTAAARAGQRGGQGVVEFPVGAHEGAEGVFPQDAVRVGHVQHVAAFADRGGIAFAVLNVGEGHVGADEGAEGAAPGRRGELTLGQQGFFLRGEDMGGLAFQVL